MRHSPCSSLLAEILPAWISQHGRAVDAARRCGLDQRIPHPLVPIVAAARSEQHGDALVDERLTSASLYGRFKGAAIPLRLSVIAGRIAAHTVRHPSRSMH